MAMWRFNRPKSREVWDEAIAGPIGDIEAAHRIRQICRSVAGSAAKIGGAPDRSDAKLRLERERYQAAAKAAMEIAIKVNDDLVRDAAVRQIVELCLAAKDSRTARTLFRAIQSRSISDEVLRAHPSLRDA